MVSRQNADIADTLKLRDVAMATVFWDYTSCTWPVMGDNYMRFRIKGG